MVSRNQTYDALVVHGLHVGLENDLLGDQDEHTASTLPEVLEEEVFKNETVARVFQSTMR